MTYQRFEDVVLLEDIAAKGLKRGDVATIVEHHPVAEGEDGYTLELFNALGDTIAVVTGPLDRGCLNAVQQNKDPSLTLRPTPFMLSLSPSRSRLLHDDPPSRHSSRYSLGFDLDGGCL